MRSNFCGRESDGSAASSKSLHDSRPYARLWDELAGAHPTTALYQYQYQFASAGSARRSPASDILEPFTKLSSGCRFPGAFQELRRLRLRIHNQVGLHFV